MKRIFIAILLPLFLLILSTLSQALSTDIPEYVDTKQRKTAVELVPADKYSSDQPTQELNNIEKVTVEGFGDSIAAARMDARTQVLDKVPGTIKAFKVIDSFNDGEWYLVMAEVEVEIGKSTNKLKDSYSISAEIQNTIDEISQAESELVVNQTKIQVKIDELQKSNPLYNPEQDPFESDSDFVARIKRIEPILKKLQQQYQGDVQQRLDAALDRVFEDQNATLTLGKYNANNEYWPITIASEYTTSEQVFHTKIAINKKAARHLHKNWDRYKKTVWLTVDADKKARVSKFRMHDSVTGQAYEYDYNLVKNIAAEGAVVVSPDQRWMVSEDSLIDLQTFERYDLNLQHPFAFSADSTMLAAGQVQGYSKSIDIIALNPKRLYKTPEKVDSFEYQNIVRVAFDPAGRMIASCKSEYSWESYCGGEYKIYDSKKNIFTDASASEAKAIIDGYKQLTSHNRYNWTSAGIKRKKRTTSIVSAPAPFAPPSLSVSLQFSEPSGNAMLDAGEVGEMIVTVKNDGNGNAEALSFRIEPESRPHLSYMASMLDNIPAGESRSVSIPIEAYMDAKSEDHKLTLHFVEANGFAPDSVAIQFQTNEWKKPKLEVAEVGVDAGSNGRIDPAEVVTLTVRVKNNGVGIAEGAYIQFHTGGNTFIADRSNSKKLIGDLRPGEFKDILVEVFTNKKAKDINVFANLTELTGQASNANIKLPIRLNRKVKQITTQVITGQKNPEYLPTDSSSLTIDIEKNIPQSETKNIDDLAIVIGIEEYKNVNNATFADRDATWFKEYIAKQFGVKNNRILFLSNENATKAALDTALGSKGWLAKRLKQGKSNVYVYYAGHGTTGIDDKESYLVPYDGDPNYPTYTSIKVDDMYKQLSLLKTKSTTLFLDACFTGQDRDNQSLLADARPVAIVPKQLQTRGLSVYTATSANQISSALQDKKHGIFSYWLMKGLQGNADTDSDSFITHNELRAYLDENVSSSAYDIDREQNPTWSGVDGDAILTKVAY